MEYLRFATGDFSSHLFQFSDLQQGMNNRIVSDNRFWFEADDAGEALFAVGDGVHLKGGAGDDYLVGIGKDTYVELSDTLFNYAITRNDNGSLTVRHKDGGTDTLTNISKLVFSDGMVKDTAAFQGGVLATSISGRSMVL